MKVNVSQNSTTGEGISYYFTYYPSMYIFYLFPFEAQSLNGLILLSNKQHLLHCWVQLGGEKKTSSGLQYCCICPGETDSRPPTDFTLRPNNTQMETMTFSH